MSLPIDLADTAIVVLLALILIPVCKPTAIAHWGSFWWGALLWAGSSGLLPLIGYCLQAGHIIEVVSLAGYAGSVLLVVHSLRPLGR